MPIILVFHRVEMSHATPNDNPNFSATEDAKIPLRWAKRAALSYLIVAMIVIALNWNGWYELGPRWNLVTMLSWPVSAFALQGIELVFWLIGVTHSDETHKIPAITVLLLTGIAYWAVLGYCAEKINRWRKTC